MSTDNAPDLWFEFDGCLHIDPQAKVLRSLTKTAWSPSSSSAVESCPARWALDRALATPLSAFSPAEQGSAAHWVFECLFGLPVGLRTREKAQEILESATPQIATENGFVFPDRDYEKWLSDVGELLDGLWKIEDPTQVVVTGTERLIDGALINGVPFKGIIDRTELLVENGLVTGMAVSDYKTARKGLKSEFFRKKYGDHHGDQLRLYALALRHLDGRLPDSLKVLYTTTGELYEPSLAPSELERVASDFAHTWDVYQKAMETLAFPARPSPLCKWCPGASVCPNAIDGWENGEAKTVYAAAQHGISAPRIDVSMSACLTSADPWLERGDNSLLNADSPAGEASFFFAALAMDQLSGVPAKRSDILGLALVLAQAVSRAQRELEGSVSLMSGVNARLRACLPALLHRDPIPLGSSEDDFSAWFDKLCGRLSALGLIASKVAENPESGSDFSALAAMAEPRAAA